MQLRQQSLPVIRRDDDAGNAYCSKVVHITCSVHDARHSCDASGNVTVHITGVVAAQQLSLNPISSCCTASYAGCRNVPITRGTFALVMIWRSSSSRRASSNSSTDRQRGSRWPLAIMAMHGHWADLERLAAFTSFGFRQTYQFHKSFSP